MHALIPIKRLALAKQRLAAVLSPAERAQLAATMLADMLGVLARHPCLDGTIVLSDDPVAAALARRFGVEHLPEPALAAPGLNGAVQAAVAALDRRGIDELMVLHADIPLVTAAEITRLVLAHEARERPALTIAPDRHREGTNCLICSPARLFKFAYGRESFVRHVRQAASVGATLKVLEMPGIGFDVDWPQDLAELALRAGGEPATQAQAYLQDTRITARLRAPAASPGQGAAVRDPRPHDGDPHNAPH